MSYYTIRPGKLKEFLDKIQSVARPSNADTKWIDTIGFNPKNITLISKFSKKLGLLIQQGNLPLDGKNFKTLELQKKQ